MFTLSDHAARKSGTREEKSRNRLLPCSHKGLGPPAIKTSPYCAGKKLFLTIHIHGNSQGILNASLRLPIGLCHSPAAMI